MSGAEKMRIRNLTHQTMASMIQVWVKNGMPNRHNAELEESEAIRVIERLKPLATRLVKRKNLGAPACAESV